jgi:DNA-binding PadR family transcriptional regulator
VLLSLIGEQPRHGYELIKAVEDLFGGGYSPSPGSVYPILTLLEEIGQIKVQRRREEALRDHG